MKLFIGAFDYFSFWVYRRLPSKSVRLSFKWKFSIRIMDNPAKFVSHSNMHSWLLPIAWRQDSTLKKACFFITLDNNRQSWNLQTFHHGPHYKDCKKNQIYLMNHCFHRKLLRFYHYQYYWCFFTDFQHFMRGIEYSNNPINCFLILLVKSSMHFWA